MNNNYIILVSDHSTSLSRIMNRLEVMDRYETLTVNTISLLLQLLNTVKPALVIISCKNNAIELSKLHSQDFNEFPLMLCLLNKFENIYKYPSNIHLMVMCLEECLRNNHLVQNIRSMLFMYTYKMDQKQIKKESLYPDSFAKEHKNLARYVLELDQKRRLLKNITERIRKLCSETDMHTRLKLNTILNHIKLDKASNHWEDFKLYFESINPGFLKSLARKYPSLTSKDLKYCCYLKMNMSNEDIRNLLGINQESVRTHKYRLKKKMVLGKEQDLKSYINLF